MDERLTFNEFQRILNYANKFMSLPNDCLEKVAARRVIFEVMAKWQFDNHASDAEIYAILRFHGDAHAEYLADCIEYRGNDDLDRIVQDLYLKIQAEIHFFQ